MKPNPKPKPLFEKQRKDLAEFDRTVNDVLKKPMTYILQNQASLKQKFERYKKDRDFLKGAMKRNEKSKQGPTYTQAKELKDGFDEKIRRVNNVVRSFKMKF